MSDLSKTLLADCEMSVRLRVCLAGYATLSEAEDMVRGTGRPYNWSPSCEAELGELLRGYPSSFLAKLAAFQREKPDTNIQIPDLQDLTYGPKVYFATLKFYSFSTPDGPDRHALTPALEHYARDGWRPVGVWSSGSDGTWIEVLLQRENGVCRPSLVLIAAETLMLNTSISA